MRIKDKRAQDNSLIINSMKKLLFLFICILFAYPIMAQEKYPVPVLTSDQKHGGAVGQAWAFAAAGMNFAKTKGVSPYEYGKYIGKLFAPSWGAGDDFDRFVNGAIYNFESFRHVSDTPLKVRDNPDGSVTVFTSEQMWHKYFPDGNQFASFNDFLEFIKGLNEPIADYMGASVTIENRDGQTIMTFRRK